jgi:hypothetical protein
MSENDMSESDMGKQHEGQPKKRVIVERREFLDHEESEINTIQIPIDTFIARLTWLAERTTDVARGDLFIEIPAYNDIWESLALPVLMFSRLETDEEVERRVKRDQHRLRSKELEERALYRRLKAKYEPGEQQ